MRRFDYGKGSKETHKGAMSIAGHGDGVGVKVMYVTYSMYVFGLLACYAAGLTVESFTEDCGSGFYSTINV